MLISALDDQMKVIIPAFFIRHKNGLWFFLLDFLYDIQKLKDSGEISSCSVIVYSRSWQDDELRRLPNVVTSSHRLGSASVIHFLMACLEAIWSKNSVIFSPAMRPLIGVRSYYLCPDYWPMCQPNSMKRSVSKMIHIFGKLFSSPIYISKSHAVSSKDLIIPCPPHPDFSWAERRQNHKIPCDVLVVGVETDRKRIGLLGLWVDYAVANGFICENPTVAIVGDRPANSGIGRLNELNVYFYSADSLFNMTPNDHQSVYLSMSSEEGFNRGAMIAQHLGFHLHLSDIPVHREFFPESTFFTINGNELVAQADDHTQFKIQSWLDGEQLMLRRKTILHMLSTEKSQCYVNGRK